MKIDLMFVLNAIIMLGAVVAAILSVTAKNTLSSVLALGALGTFIALEFSLLQAFCHSGQLLL